MGLVVFQKPGQEGALDAVEDGGIGEEFEWSVHLGFLSFKSLEEKMGK
jgi:hypothetical protein